jgi:hypothetical protein
VIQLDLEGKRFSLGRLLQTRAVLLELEEPEIEVMVQRHLDGDWGDLDDEDKALNEHALEVGNRLLSLYVLEGERYYVITEWDRSLTTVLRADEY